MTNLTPHIIQNLRDYIKFVGWKYQPKQDWEDEFELISFRKTTHYKSGEPYLTVKVFLHDSDYFDVTIPVNRLNTFLHFYNFKKPKKFNPK